MTHETHRCSVDGCPSRAVSFSLGMQVGVTAVNAAVGLAATMLLFRTIRPLAAVRAPRGRTP